MFRLAAPLVLALALAACSGVTTPPAAQTAPPAAATVAPVEPTPEPSDLVDVYAGKIIFGDKYNADKLTIAVPKSSFSRKAKAIAWVAHLIEPAGATKITTIVVRTTAGGSEEIVDSAPVVVSPDWTLLGGKEDLAGYMNHKAGTYVMRIVRGGTVLAEGTFKLTK